MVYKITDIVKIEAVDKRYHGCRLDGFDRNNGLRRCTVLARNGAPYAWSLYAPDAAYASAVSKLLRMPTVGEVLKEMKLLEKAEK